jgi:micrococcal nuclease
MVVATVIRIVDCDTIQVDIINPPDDLQNSETVRLIGVDTPETVHPSKPVEHFGKEASDFTKSRLEGKMVYLAFDWDLRDFYRRLLAYVYLEDGTCHNAAIIKEGYGFAYLTYSFQFADEFAVLQREAREKNKGLW